MRTLILLALAAPPAFADSLCGQTDGARLTALLAGDWDRTAHISLENETLSVLRQSAPEVATIAAVDAGFEDAQDGPILATFATAFVDAALGTPVPLGLARGAVYDVDAVDDMLDTTETAEFADLLSDTPCGPESLPQLQGRLQAGEGMVVDGTVTLIPYFDDRILEISEFELRSDATIIFMTATALLTPAQ